MVATVTTICADVLPLKLIDAGVIAQVAPLGAPLHVSATAPVNATGEISILYVAV